MNWKEHFYYHDGKLFWARTNVVAGYIHGSGYVRVGLQGKSYAAYRIIYELHYGPIECGYEVDHINHIRHDNRIENLRLVTHQQNNCNRTLQSNNKSGVPGVHWDKRRCKYVVRITVQGHKYHIGYFDDFNEAVAARREAEVNNRFHENHGLKGR